MALAGPVMNIVLAVIFGLLFRVIVSAPGRASIVLLGIQWGREPVLAQYLYSLGVVNIILAVFNLIPIPPLDGSSVLERLMPRQWLPDYLSIRPYTIFLPFLIIWLHPQWLDDVFQAVLQPVGPSARPIGFTQL